MAQFLLVDDDASNVLTLSALLETEGFVIDAEHSLRGALERTRTKRGYDLVLLDRHLVDGEGLSIVPQLRRDLGPVPIVLMTGDAPAEDCPVDAVVVKGTSFESVVQQLRALIDREREPR